MPATATKQQGCGSRAPSRRPRAVPPDEKPAKVRDRRRHKIKGEKGLYYRDTAEGRSYECCATPPGETQAVWKTLGVIPLEEARDGRDAHRQRVRRTPLPEKQKRKFTVNDVADLALEALDQRVAAGEIAPRTRNAYRSVINYHIRPQFGKRLVASVTIEDIVAWGRKMKMARVEKASIVARWAAARVVFNYAARHGYTPVHPMNGLERSELPDTPDSKQVFLTKHEIGRMILTAKSGRYLSAQTRLAMAPAALMLRIQVMVVACALMVFCGLRISEVVGLWWDDIDLDEGSIGLVAQLDQTTDERVPLKARNRVPRHGEQPMRLVPLPAFLVALLRELRLLVPHECPWVCARADGTPTRQKALGYDFRLLRVAAGLAESITPHALRHTYVTVLRDAGEAIEFISKKIGHLNVAITQKVYTHLMDEDRKDDRVRDTLDAGFRELVTAEEPESVVLAFPTTAAADADGDAEAA